MLLFINEKSTWQDPLPVDATLREKQDEEIFQTARLVHCGHFMALIFGVYVAGFLGLGRSENSWSMNPFDVGFLLFKLIFAFTYVLALVAH